MAPVSRFDLQEAIVTAIVSRTTWATIVPICTEHLGLIGALTPEDGSKPRYVRNRIENMAVGELLDVAARVREEFGDDPDLAAIVSQLSATGVAGDLKNLIFAADGPKPRIILKDAINNTIEIVENAQFCLVYDRVLSGEGLSWRDLVSWWAATTGQEPGRGAASSLYQRLERSLGSDAERRLFSHYAGVYRRLGPTSPALIPQVYLHYDPYTKREMGVQGREVRRQRMDFLLLVTNRQRIVIEVDGRQHYASGGGYADVHRYAEMAREDRELRLTGYEVYRFGASELMAEPSVVTPMLDAFFDRLLQKHGVAGR